MKATSSKEKIYKIPFHSQIWNLDQWNELGFKSREDALYWQNSSCGVLCLKMAIEGLLGTETDSIYKIIEKGKEISAYSHVSGWSHKGLVDLAKKYGLDAYSSETLNENKLKQILNKGSLVIVSIKWAFDPSKTFREKILFWKKKGGHLSLVIGYEEKRGFIVNHTSISRGYNWQEEVVSFKKFSKGFTGRGVILSLQNINRS